MRTRIWIIVPLFFLIACQNEPATSTAAEVVPAPAMAAQDSVKRAATKARKAKLMSLVHDEDASEPMCRAYRVVDGNGNSVSMPAKLRELLRCPDFITNSMVGNVLILDDEKGLQQYHFAEERFEHILDLPDDLDGLSHVRWSSDGQKLALVAIHQDKFAEKTKIYVLDFADGKLTGTSAHAVKVNFHCGAACTTRENDFGFVDNANLYYRTYDKIPYDIDKANNKMTIALP